MGDLMKLLTGGRQQGKTAMTDRAGINQRATEHQSLLERVRSLSRQVDEQERTILAMRGRNLIREDQKWRADAIGLLNYAEDIISGVEFEHRRDKVHAMNVCRDIKLFLTNTPHEWLVPTSTIYREPGDDL